MKPHLYEKLAITISLMIAGSQTFVFADETRQSDSEARAEAEALTPRLAYRLGLADSLAFVRSQKCEGAAPLSRTVSDRLLGFSLLKDLAKGKPKAEAYIKGMELGYARAISAEQARTLCE